MATGQDIKDFFALIGKEITNAHLARLLAALERNRGFTDNAGKRRDAAADDFIQKVYDWSRDLANNVTEEEARRAARPNPQDLIPR